MSHTPEIRQIYLTTVRFEMPHRIMATRLMTIYGRPWLYGAAILTAAAGIAAIFDLRWLIVGLMILLIATPLMLALLYLNYGLRPACVANVLPHTVELLPDALRVKVWARELSELSEWSELSEKSELSELSELSESSEWSELSEKSELSESSDNSDSSDSSDNSDFSDNSDNSDNSDTPPSPAVIHLFPLDSLRPYTVGLDSVTIPIAGKGFLWISSSAFSNPDGLTIFMQALSQARITAPT